METQFSKSKKYFDATRGGRVRVYVRRSDGFVFAHVGWEEQNTLAVTWKFMCADQEANSKKLLCIFLRISTKKILRFPGTHSLAVSLTSLPRLFRCLPSPNRATIYIFSSLSFVYNFLSVREEDIQYNGWKYQYVNRDGALQKNYLKFVAFSWKKMSWF